MHFRLHLVIHSFLIATILGQDAQAYLWPTIDASKDDMSGDDAEAPAIRLYHQLGMYPLPLYGIFFKCRYVGYDGTPIRYASSTASSTPTSSAPSSPISHTTSLEEDKSSLKLDDTAASTDFRSECILSLERAFEENHSVDNAAIELKTLRMASNVPLRSVKQVVISFLLSKIQLSETPAQQKQAVNKTVERWGPLLPAIGGEDPIENILLLQVRGCRLHFDVPALTMC